MSVYIIRNALIFRFKVVKKKKVNIYIYFFLSSIMDAEVHIDVKNYVIMLKFVTILL